MSFRRFAIYFGPRPGNVLSRFGRDWFGTDPETGESLEAVPLSGWRAQDHAQMIATPRRYALHGTLKPPFTLAEGRTQAELHDAVRDLATTLKPVPLGRLSLTRLGGFLALCPAAPSQALSELAGQCVRELDLFRAPAGEAEIARRRKAGLNERQERYLQQWGYPYVFEEFRFHVTLTGRLDPVDVDKTFEALCLRLAPVTAEEQTLEDLCLYGEPTDGSPFRIVERFSLTGG